MEPVRIETDPPRIVRPDRPSFPLPSRDAIHASLQGPEPSDWRPSMVVAHPTRGLDLAVVLTAIWLREVHNNLAGARFNAERGWLILHVEDDEMREQTLALLAKLDEIMPDDAATQEDPHYLGLPLFREQVDEKREKSKHRTPDGEPVYAPISVTVNSPTLLDLCFRIARHFLPPEGGSLVDFGCLAGDFLEKVRGHTRAERLIGLEAHPVLLKHSRDRFEESDRVDIRFCELEAVPAHSELGGPVDVVVAFHTLQHVQSRHAAIQSIHDAMRPGGALILVEKLLPAGALLHRIFREEGLQDEAGIRDDLGPDHLLSHAWMRDLLTGQGFSEVDCFWRHFNAGGFVARRS